MEYPRIFTENFSVVLGRLLRKISPRKSWKGSRMTVAKICSRSLQTILQQRSREIATTRGRWALDASVFNLGFLVSQTKDPAERTKLMSQNFCAQPTNHDSKTGLSFQFPNTNLPFLPVLALKASLKKSFLHQSRTGRHLGRVKVTVLSKDLIIWNLIVSTAVLY